MLACTVGGDHLQQRLERVGHIGTIHGLAAVGHPEQALECHDMVDPQAACARHVRLQQPGKRRLPLCGHHIGAPGRQAPGLPIDAEGIGWCADLEAHRHQPLLSPGIGAAGIHTDGQVGDRADGGFGAARALADPEPLRMSQPLNERVQANPILMQAFEGLRCGGIRARELRWPLPPVGPPLHIGHGFEERVDSQPPGMPRPPGMECLARCAVRRPCEVGPEPFKPSPFKCEHPRIVHLAAASYGGQRSARVVLLQPGGQARRVDAGGGQRQADEQRVERQPARRRIGRSAIRPAQRGRMKRRDQHARGADGGGLFDQGAQVVEIANPPAVGGADRIKLRRDRPASLRTQEFVWQERASRGDIQGNPLGLMRAQGKHMSGACAKRLPNRDAVPLEPSGCQLHGFNPGGCRCIRRDNGQGLARVLRSVGTALLGRVEVKRDRWQRPGCVCVDHQIQCTGAVMCIDRDGSRQTELPA